MSTAIPQNRASFSAHELSEATSGVFFNGKQAGVLGVATDTRQELSGKAFVALRGERYDAHDYLEVAARAGAAVLVVEQCASTAQFLSSRTSESSASVLVVRDTLQALGDLAALQRKRWGGRLAAVAGSAGKTTTRSALTALMNQICPHEVLGTLGNLNNRVGLPMTLLGLCTGHRYAVVELGTNRPGEIQELARISDPDVAVLTLVDLEHTEGLGDLDGVEEEEKAVFGRLDQRGTAVGLRDDDRVLRSIQACRAGRKVTYGFERECDFRIESWNFVDEVTGITVIRRGGGTTLRIQSSLVGRPGALATAAAVAAAEALSGQQISSQLASEALNSAGEPGRNTVRRMSGDRIVIDDTYNSNPISVDNSIATGQALAATTGGRLWLVLGEMLELGSLSSESHEQMGRTAGASGAAGVFFVQGDALISFENCVGNIENSSFHEGSASVAAALAPQVGSGDVVVVKASRGVRAERVVEGLAARWGVPDGDFKTAPIGVDR